MATYTIEPTRENLHGTFSRELPPVLTVDSGDTVVLRTLDAGWGIEPHDERNQRRRFEPRDPVLDRGHALCGPIAVRGAEPGMTLEVRIEQLRTAGWGWNSAGGWESPVNTRLGVAHGEEFFLRWTLDDDTQVARSHLGHEVRMNPHFGVLGMPPDEPGRHPTSPPRVSGGNIDCRELQAGSTLYLPIPVAGALFSAGDGHAAMADGEVSTIAIECPMERAALTLTLRDDLRLATPRANTPAGWLTMGFDEDLDEAMFVALDAMLDLMRELHEFGRREALALASLVVNLRITQVVNGVRGVHALLPHDAIRRVTS
jgi:acetamidase/formamidase